MNYNDEHDFSSYETDVDSYNAYKTENISFNNTEKNNTNNKKNYKGPSKLYLVFLFLAFFITAMSVSVAFFTTSARSKVIQEIESAVVNFSLKVEKITQEEKKGLVPVKDDEMLNALKGTNGKQCVDINGNTVCQIYKVSVSNDSDYSTAFKSTLGLIASQDSEYENLKWAEILYSDTPSILGDIKPMSNSNWKTNYGIGANTTGQFYVVIWISDNGVNQNNSDYGNFTGNITFEAVSGDKLTSTFSSK